MNRDRSLRILNVLDNWTPPAVRDSRVLERGLMRLAWGPGYREFLGFREKSPRVTDEELATLYEHVAQRPAAHGETDLNEPCLRAIQSQVVGRSVLDVGSGRGLLCSALAAPGRMVTGLDLALPPGLSDRENLTFVAGSVTDLPFDDNSFDTVVCTHTLEHIPQLGQALAELRRVAAEKLIIVVPRERPYRYGFNLHVHFFPYRWNLESAFDAAAHGGVLNDLGDWFYVETSPRP